MKRDTEGRTPGGIEGLVARVLALRESLVGLDCLDPDEPDFDPDEADEAERGRRELGKRIRELRGRLERTRRRKEFRGWTAEERIAFDLLEDLEGPPPDFLFDVGAVYGVHLAGAFARLGAGEDAAAVYAGTPWDFLRCMVERTERLARWNAPAPDFLEGFGIMVGMLEWLCGKPAGEWRASPLLGWVLDAVGGWMDGACEGAVQVETWRHAQGARLAATVEGMSGGARRKLAFGLAAYCARWGEAARGEIRTILQGEEAGAEIAEARADAHHAREEWGAEAAEREKAENARRKLAVQLERLREKQDKAGRMAAAAGMKIDLPAVANLRERGGKTIAETARELGVSESTVKRRWADYREKTGGRRLPAGRPGLKIANMGTEQAEREQARGGRTPHRGT